MGKQLVISWIVQQTLDTDVWNLGPWIRMHDMHDSSLSKETKSTVEMKWTCNKTVDVLSACTTLTFTNYIIYLHAAHVPLKWSDFFLSNRKIVHQSTKEHANWCNGLSGSKLNSFFGFIIHKEKFNWRCLPVFNCHWRNFSKYIF